MTNYIKNNDSVQNVTKALLPYKLLVNTYYVSTQGLKIFTGYLFLLVLISKFFYRSTSVYMELPRTISLLNFRSMHAKLNMTMRSDRQWTLSNCISLNFNLNKFGYRAFSVAGPRIWNDWIGLD